MNFVGPDAPSAADMRRQAVARSEARRQLAAAEALYVTKSIEAFRHEIGATVRSASPFLIALLKAEGLDLDDVVEAIEPGHGWPCRPQTASRRNELLASKHAFRHIVAGLLPDLCTDIQSRHGVSVDLSDYSSAKIYIDAHSIEVWVLLRTVTFITGFGLLRIKLEQHLPETLTIACVGRRVKDVVDHPALRGHDWRVAAVEASSSGSVLVVETGSTPYRLPWS